jgi:Uma2 family endonuclease
MGETKTRELLEVPLSREDLSARYRALCDDPRFDNLPGKIELDSWGRILMSPASNYHALVQGRLCRRLAALGGESFVEASVVTSVGLFAPDVVWASAEFMRAHASETPYTRAPEICVEVASPSNSGKELREKADAYLGAGAVEVWIAFPQTKRFEFFPAEGKSAHSRYVVDLSGVFD